MGPDLVNPKWMYLKAICFVLIAFLCAAGLFLNTLRMDTLVMILLLIWSSARAYYFCFYVIERYIDPGYRFSGLGSVIMYALRGRSVSDPDG